ncbi:hypothetical protein FRC14_006618 [Serendipita sp. 396]|nr:hypothetical protein FRC14_006618 [Serendipita sp. 396]KAG8779646.1 hypothetical protein FRC15_010034 [Serendipita sp. 397]
MTTVLQSKARVATSTDVVEGSSGLSAEEKERLIENLNIEVTNHRRRYEAFLEQLLEGFSLRHGMEVMRIPKSIRHMKMKDFDRFGGNVQACVQAIAKQRVAESEGEANEKKRKWQTAIQEAGLEEERALKTPRVAPPSPVKPTPRGVQNKTAKGAVGRTTGTQTSTKAAVQNAARRMMMPTVRETTMSPTKSRPASPVKQTSSFKPASTTFNPVLPPKTPVYPRRQAKQNETVMSVNGTPLAIPWRLEKQREVDTEEEEDADEDSRGGREGGIIVRRNQSSKPSYSFSSSSTAVSSGTTGTMITIATQKGQTIQFDPLTTSPGSFDRLPDLTASAKKQVKEDTARIIQALGKWRL